MKSKTDIPEPAENLKSPKEDRNNELLLKWKKSFTALNPNEIEVFIFGQENFPTEDTIEEWSHRIDFSRLDGLVRFDHVRIVLSFSDRLKNHFGSVAIGLSNNSAFFGDSIRPCGDPEWLDTLGEHGMITWQKMYEEILAFENARRSEIPVPPKE